MDPVDPDQPENPTEAEDAVLPTVVSHCSTLNEAQMVVSLLGSFGIEAAIDSENYYRLLGSMVPGLEGVRVQVRPQDAAAALEILEGGASNPPTDEQGDDNSEL